MGTACANSCIVVATDGSLKWDWSMGAALVAKVGSLPASSVAVFGQPSSLRPKLTGIALALEDCPGEEDLNILTNSLSSMRQLKSMQRGDFSSLCHSIGTRPCSSCCMWSSSLPCVRGRDTSRASSRFVNTEESHSMNPQTRWQQKPPSLIQHTL